MALDQCLVLRNRPLLGAAPHNWLGHIRTEARKREVRLSARPTHSSGRGWPHQVRRRRARPHMGAWRRWARGRASRCPGADAIAAGSTTTCARGDVGVVRGPACPVILMPPGSSRSRRQAVSMENLLNPATPGRASRRLPGATAIPVGTGRLSRSLAQARGQAGPASLAAWDRSGRRRPGEMD